MVESNIEKVNEEKKENEKINVNKNNVELNPYMTYYFLEMVDNLAKEYNLDSLEQM
jgi:hypothetical protein